MDKVLVIAPDKPSGEAFEQALKNRGRLTELLLAEIEPRVLGEKINPDPKVRSDLVLALKKGYDMGFRKMVIACNTLQLWLIEALETLPEKITSQIKVVTTFEAVGQMFPDQNDRPVWLGTTVTTDMIQNYPTLKSLNQEKLQKLTQEIIWRTKGVTGADTSTASEDIENIKSEILLKEKVSNFVLGLKSIGIKTAVMGCTELPIALINYANESETAGLKLIDPAEAVAEII